jgi:predicted metal-dependent phosphoesterase TrpH
MTGHTHSTASDGSLSPRQLITEAHAIGLSAIALTDHDTIDGLDEARSKAGTVEYALFRALKPRYSEIRVDFTF